MLLTRLFFAAALAAAFGSGGQVAAYPLTITLPPSTVTAPGSPILPGSWHDGRCLLLLPVSPGKTAAWTLQRIGARE